MSTSFFRSPAFKAFAKRTYASQPTPGASAQATVDSAVSKASKTAESTLEQAQKTALEYGQKAQKMAGPTGQKVFNRVSGTYAAQSGWPRPEAGDKSRRWEISPFFPS